MIGPATAEKRTATTSSTLTEKGNEFGTSSAFFELNAWRFRQHGHTSGFARYQTGTSRQVAGMRADGSNTVTTNVGARYATKVSSIVSQISPKHCQRFGVESLGI
jgi:hypothetical protein